MGCFDLSRGMSCVAATKAKHAPPMLRKSHESVKRKMQKAAAAAKHLKPTEKSMFHAAVPDQNRDNLFPSGLMKPKNMT